MYIPLVSLVVAIAQGALGGGIVTTVARVLGRPNRRCSEFAWYAVVLGVPLGIATTVVMVALVRPFTRTRYLRKCSGDRHLLFVHHFCGRHGDLVVQPPDGGGRGTGNLQVPVIVVCGGALILVPLSLVLISGAFGYPGLVPRAALSRCLCIMRSERWPTPPISGAGSACSSVVSCAKTFAGAGACHSPCRGMSAVVSATTNLTLAIVTAYVAMGGVEAWPAMVRARARVSSGALAYGIGGPVGIVISANLGAGQIEASRKGVLDRRSDGLRPD